MAVKLKVARNRDGSLLHEVPYLIVDEQGRPIPRPVVESVFVYKGHNYRWILQGNKWLLGKSVNLIG